MTGRYAPDTTSGTPNHWTTRAACQGAPTELFFPNARRAATEATRYCDHCPVFDACDQDAKRQHHTSGVWAGQYWEEGKPHDIRQPTTATPKPRLPNRSERAANRRRDALGRLRMIRHQHPSDRAAWAQIAREYGVNPQTVRDWAHAAETEAQAAHNTRTRQEQP